MVPSPLENFEKLPIANHRKSIALSPGMELKSVVAVIRHGDRSDVKFSWFEKFLTNKFIQIRGLTSFYIRTRTPKQKMKMVVSHRDFVDIFTRYKGFIKGKIKLKKPRELQEVLDVSRKLISVSVKTLLY